MPRTAPKKLTKKERIFVNLFLKLGANESKIEECAQKCELSAAAAHRLLKQKAVKKDIAEWKEVVELEQERQRLIGPAVAQVTEALVQKTEEATVRAQVAETELNE